MKKVIIKWEDSNVVHGWQINGETPYELALCESIGYMPVEYDDKLVLIQTISNFGAYMGVLSIPKGCIKSIKELRLK